MIDRSESQLLDGKFDGIEFGYDEKRLPASLQPFSKEAKARLVEFFGELTMAIQDGRLTSYGGIGAAIRSIDQIVVESSPQPVVAINGIEYGRDLWSDEKPLSVAQIVECQSSLGDELEASIATIREAAGRLGIG